jgi:hypothetical protein
MVPVHQIDDYPPGAANTIMGRPLHDRITTALEGLELRMTRKFRDTGTTNATAFARLSRPPA